MTAPDCSSLVQRGSLSNSPTYPIPSAASRVTHIRSTDSLPSCLMRNMSFTISPFVSDFLTSNGGNQKVDGNSRFNTSPSSNSKLTKTLSFLCLLLAESWPFRTSSPRKRLSSQVPNHALDQTRRYPLAVRLCTIQSLPLHPQYSAFANVSINASDQVTGESKVHSSLAAISAANNRPACGRSSSENAHNVLSVNAPQLNPWRTFRSGSVG